VTDNGTPTSRAAVAQAKNPPGIKSDDIAIRYPGGAPKPTLGSMDGKARSAPDRKPQGATHADFVVNRSGKKPEKHAPPKVSGRR
jgi:hypothetical protein